MSKAEKATIQSLALKKKMRKLGMSAEEAENLEIVRELERFEILSACELFERENVSEKRVCQGASVRLSICLYAHFFRILLVS